MTGALEALVSKIRALGLKHASRHQAGGADEVSLAGMSPAAVLESLFDANTILKADSDDTPVALAVAASRILGRKAAGGIAALTAAEVATILTLTNYILKSTLGANSILKADSASTPIQLAVAASRIVGRQSTGSIAALTAGEVATLLNFAVRARAAINDVIGSDGKLDADLDADGHDITKLDALHFGSTPTKMFDWQTSKLISRKARLFDPSIGMWQPVGTITETETGSGACAPNAMSIVLATGATSASVAGGVGWTPFYHNKDLPGYRWGIAFRLAENAAQTDELELWAGMFADTTTFPLAASNHYGIQIVSTANGVPAKVYASSGNGVNGNRTEIDDYAALYSKEFVMLFGATAEVRYYLDGALVATHDLATGYTPNALNLFYGAWMKNTEAVAKTATMLFPKVTVFDWTDF